MIFKLNSPHWDCPRSCHIRDTLTKPRCNPTQSRDLSHFEAWKKNLFTGDPSPDVSPVANIASIAMEVEESGCALRCVAGLPNQEHVQLSAIPVFGLIAD